MNHTRCPRCGKFSRNLDVHHDPPRSAGGAGDNAPPQTRRIGDEI